MISMRPGATSQAWAMIQLAWRRERNLWRSMYGRKTNPRMGCLGSAFLLYILGVFVVFGWNAAAAYVRCRPEGPGPAGFPELLIPGSALPGIMQMLLLVLLSGLLHDLASQNLTRPGWDVEWLVTLPIPLRTLLALRIAQRMLASRTLAMVLLPCCAALAWHAGWGWLTLPVGLALGLPVALVQACLVVLAEFWMRLRLAPAWVRTLQGVMLVGSATSFLLVWAPGMGPERGPDYFLFRLARQLNPEVMGCLPSSLAGMALLSRHGLDACRLGGLALAQGLLLATLTVHYLEKVLRQGVFSGIEREARLPAGPEAPGFLSPIPWRELLLLRRDQTVLTTTLLLPAIVLVMQLAVNPDAMATLLAQPRHLSAAAFGMSAYALLLSVYPSLMREGAATWLLFTLPHRPERILLEKAAVWGGVALAYALAVLGVGAAYQGSLANPQTWILALVLAAGVALFTVIALCLGVEGTDPLNFEGRPGRMRYDYGCLFLALSSCYSLGIYTSDGRVRGLVITLSALLTLALWQRMVERLPYLLDPTGQPPPRITAADGLLAALAFTILQSVFSGGDALSPPSRAAAGLLVYGAVRFIFHRRGVAAPRLWGSGGGLGLAAGTAAGLAAGLAGGLYLLGLHALHQLPPVSLEQLARPYLLTVLAAPLFEEFIFRGLVFQGLDRQLSGTPAVLLSAAVFAMIQPALWIVPAFLLGVGTAVVYRRRPLLCAPMATHAVYSSTVTLIWAALAGH